MMTPSINDEEDDNLDDNFAPDGIDTPSDDMYNVYNTNFKRKPPGKSKPSRACLLNLASWTCLPTQAYLQHAQ